MPRVSPIRGRGQWTILPATWDAAIMFLAAHHGFMAVGEENRGTYWLNRAVSYASSRITDDMIERTEPGQGSTLVNSQFAQALLQQAAQGAGQR